MSAQLDCPVDFIKVNENKVRITALLVLLCGILFLITQLVWIPALLVIDFLLRAAKFGKLSPLNKLSELLVKLFSVSNKPTDQAPKRFAAGMGCVFTLLITVAALSGFPITAIVLTCLLLLFASLESMAGFCVGCYVYTFYRKLF